MKTKIMLFVVMCLLITPGTILAMEWEKEQIAKGWEKLTVTELLGERPKDITLVGIGDHKGKFMYFDPSGLKMFFVWEGTDCCDGRGTRAYQEYGYCDTWEIRGHSVCYPKDRSVWKKGELRAVFSVFGDEKFVYLMNKGDIKNLGS